MPTHINTGRPQRASCTTLFLFIVSILLDDCCSFRKAGAKVSTFLATTKYFKGNFYQKMQIFQNLEKINGKTPYYII